MLVCNRGFARALIVAISVALAGSVAAQSVREDSPEQGTTCPPDVKGEPPSLGADGTEPLSDKLARSAGVICPPAGIDRDMEVDPPGGGRLRIVPPPGSADGDPHLVPK